MGPGGPHLVVGDDGSANADVVWSWIAHHDWPGWRVSVVSAHLPPLGVPAPVEQSTAHPWEPTRPRRLRVGADVTAVEHLTAQADPRTVLNSFGHAALVAVGPRGRGVLKHLHIGSTTEWLLLRPPAPLAIIRSGRTTRHVLVCVDGSRHAQRAVQAVAGLPWVGRCRVTLLAAATSGSTADAERGIEAAADVLRPTGAELTERLITAVPPGTLTFDARSVILDAVANDPPDLVTLGTRGLGGLRRLILGSTASAVAHHAPCSVLVARGRTEVDPSSVDESDVEEQ